MSLDMLRETLAAIPIEEVVRPKIAIASALQEADDLLVLTRAKKVYKALVSVGEPADFTDDLEQRIAGILGHRRRGGHAGRQHRQDA